MKADTERERRERNARRIANTYGCPYAAVIETKIYQNIITYFELGRGISICYCYRAKNRVNTSADGRSGCCTEYGVHTSESRHMGKVRRHRNNTVRMTNIPSQLHVLDRKFQCS